MPTENQKSVGKYRLRQATLVGAVVAVTSFTWLVALNVRRWHEHEFRLSSGPVQFRFEPFLVGISVQQLVVPVALIYVLSNAKFFERIVSAGPAPRRRDTLKLFGALALIQFLFLNYDWLAFRGDRAFLGILVVVAGGLLGGWQVGLGLGLITLVVRPTQFLITADAHNLRTLWLVDGWRGVREAARPMMLGWYYLENLSGLVAPWAGTVAGIGGELLGRRRFSPLAMLGATVVIYLVAGYWVTLTWIDRAQVPAPLLSTTLVSGSAITAIALMVRGVQTEAAQRRAEAAELARAHAELRALRAQINPHFLFNALNTIRYFVRTDPETARRLLLNLSEIFQRSLHSGDLVPLQDEKSYVEAYLALEKARLGERLQVGWSIAPEVELDYQVPTLILQPIVENAVIHGIARKPEGGTVRIAIERMDGDLLLRVEDDGEGIPPALLPELLEQEQGRGKAIGLRNVDGRLRALYGEEYGLTLESEIGRGTRVTIRIPVER